MKIERFKYIIEYNNKNQDEISKKVRDFYSKINMDYERDLLNLMLISRPLFNKRNYLVLEIPFKDQEIGAICYKSDSYIYTLLNSNLPKVNTDFALAHEIYHIFYQCEPFKQKIELYINEHYFEHEEELSANLFAGILLMPTPSFTNLFKSFYIEKSDDDSDITLIVKLMSYFEVPFMSVVIRCYELKLLTNGDSLKKLLNVKNDIIKKEFSRLWLDEQILMPTKKDDYPKLEQLVKDIGTKYENEQLLNNTKLLKVLDNMNLIYKKIRG